MFSPQMFPSNIRQHITRRSVRISRVPYVFRQASTFINPLHITEQRVASPQYIPSAEAIAAFEAIVFARHASGTFDITRVVTDDTLGRILALTLRTPSGHNLQPYRAVIVRDREVKTALAMGMLGGNAERVEHAPISIVFAADLQPWREVDALVAMEAQSGMRSGRYLRRLPFEVGVLTSGAGATPSSNECDTIASTTVAAAVHATKAAVMGAAAGVYARAVDGPAVLPTISSPEAYAFKQAGMAAQTLMLAATAYGLGSHAMEGFYAPLVRKACGIPSRYEIPMVISLGYEATTKSAHQPAVHVEAEQHTTTEAPTPPSGSSSPTPSSTSSQNTIPLTSRLPPAVMFRLNHWNTAFHAVPLNLIVT